MYFFSFEVIQLYAHGRHYWREVSNYFDILSLVLNQFIIYEKVHFVEGTFDRKFEL